MTKSAKFMVGRRHAARGFFGIRLSMPLAALALVSTWSVPAAADNGMQTYEFEFKRCSAAMPLPDGTTDCDVAPYYVSCLGEFVVGEYHVAGRSQEFAAPSGTAHVRDNWQYSSLLSGVSTGRSWYAAGPSPFSINEGKATTFSSNGSLIYKPLADGPTWQERFVFTFIQNAGGKVVVDSATSSYKCLGAVD